MKQELENERLREEIETLHEQLSLSQESQSKKELRLR